MQGGRYEIHSEKNSRSYNRIINCQLLAFLAFEVIPGDPARSILGTEATESKVQALREEMGLNRPLPQRYGQW